MSALVQLPPQDAWLALRAQAASQPQQTAVLAKRHGRWQALSWSALERAVQQATPGWARLGVGPGKPLNVLGPLSPASLVSLFAVHALGASLELAQPGAEAAALAQAGVLLVDGGHDLDLALRAPAASLRQVVVADALALAGVAAPAGVHLQGFDALLATGGPAVADPSPASADAGGQELARLHLSQGGVQRLHRAELNGTLGTELARRGPRDRALAEFDLAWLPGLAWLLGPWARAGLTLVLPEPGGDALRDRQEAGAVLWLVPAAGLRRLSATLADRMPARGLAAVAVHAALAGETHGLARWARWRVRQRLGLAGLRTVVSDTPADAEAQQLIIGLGLDRPGPADRGQAAAPAAAHPAERSPLNLEGSPS